MELFAREYVVDLNGTRAAIAAGYAENSAHVEASRLLKKDKVQKIIQRLQSKRASKLELTEARISEEMQRLAFSNMLDYIGVDEEGKPTSLDLRNLTRDQAAAICEIREDATGGTGDGERKLILRTTFKLADKMKALHLLGQHLGMFQERVEHSADDALLAALAAGRRRVTDLP